MKYQVLRIPFIYGEIKIGKYCERLLTRAPETLHLFHCSELICNNKILHMYILLIIPHTWF